jgi:drug/metabolite transporter (DMT)-like permease
MLGPDLLQDLGSQVAAQLAVLGAALSYAFAGIFGRRFKTLGVAPIAVATGQVTASTALLTPVMLLVDQPWTLSLPGMGTVLALLGLATLSTAFAYVLYFRILEQAGATNLLLVTFLIPISAVMLGILFLNEHLLARHLLGMLVIGLGLAAIDGRLLTLLRRQKASLNA